LSKTKVSMLVDWAAEAAQFQEKIAEEVVKKENSHFLENKTTWIMECIEWV